MGIPTQPNFGLQDERDGMILDTYSMSSVLMITRTQSGPVDC